MFAPVKPSNSKRRKLTLAGSLAAHALVVWTLCLSPAPIFIKPIQIAHGLRGASMVLYYTPPGDQITLVAERSKSFPVRLYLPARKKNRFNARITNQKNVDAQNSDPVSKETAGSPNSSDFYGETTGADVRPAIETTLVDPPVARSEIPAGVVGDVVIEITIDAQGAVTDAKLIQGLGYGIDEKIIATVRNWHYRPATRDGVPIPSKYDARWHFPS